MGSKRDRHEKGETVLKADSNRDIQEKGKIVYRDEQ